MGLEAVVLCIDNSEWMRNSDFSPSRAEAQEDACNLICGTKTRQNVENVVGLITTAGKAVEVRVSLTGDLAKFLTALHKVRVGGKADVMAAIQVAQLALRHRQNKKQAQRIILFVGSPVEESQAELVSLGGQLKKNKIAVDVISFGEINTGLNQDKLEAFHKAVNNNDNSAIVTIPPGTHMLSEHLARTPIIRGEAAPGGSTAPASGVPGFDFVDENVDPELAMTLKLSLETEEAERKARQTEVKAETPSASAGGPAAPAVVGAEVNMMEEDPELAEAIRQSMMGMAAAAPAEAEGDDDEFQRALQMSQLTAQADRDNDEKTALLQKAAPATPEQKPKEEPNQDVDPDYISQVFLGLPDIDPNDPDVKDLLESMRKQNDEKK